MRHKNQFDDLKFISPQIIASIWKDIRKAQERAQKAFLELVNKEEFTKQTKILTRKTSSKNWLEVTNKMTSILGLGSNPVHELSVNKSFNGHMGVRHLGNLIFLNVDRDKFVTDEYWVKIIEIQEQMFSWSDKVQKLLDEAPSHVHTGLENALYSLSESLSSFNEMPKVNFLKKLVQSNLHYIALRRSIRNPISFLSSEKKEGTGGVLHVLSCTLLSLETDREKVVCTF